MSSATTNSYDIDTLARLARVAPSTLRVYVAAGVLPRAVLHGRNTRYDDAYLTRVRVVRHLLHVERLPLRAIRAKLSRLSDAEVLALLPVAASAARAPAPPPAAPAATEPDASIAPGEVATPAGGEAWSRVPLLPGLELHVSASASAVVKKLAAEVAATFRAQPSGSA